MPRFEMEASLRIWGVDAVIAGQEVRIPPLPAADWLPAMASGDVTGILRLAGVSFRRQLIVGEITRADLAARLNEMLEQAAGRSSWSALVLAGAAAAHWHVIGPDLARAGVRFDRVSIGAALDAIYGSLCRSMDAEGVQRFNLSLDRAEGEPVPTGARVPDRLIEKAKSLPATAEQYVRERPKTQLRRPQPLPDGPSVQPTPRRRRRGGNGQAPGTAVPGAGP